MEKLCLLNKKEDKKASYIKNLLQNSLFYGREACESVYAKQCVLKATERRNKISL